MTSSEGGCEGKEIEIKTLGRCDGLWKMSSVQATPWVPNASLLLGARRRLSTAPECSSRRTFGERCCFQSSASERGPQLRTEPGKPAANRSSGKEPLLETETEWRTPAPPSQRQGWKEKHTEASSVCWTRTTPGYASLQCACVILIHAASRGLGRNTWDFPCHFPLFTSFPELKDHSSSLDTSCTIKSGI